MLVAHECSAPYTSEQGQQKQGHTILSKGRMKQRLASSSVGAQSHLQPERGEHAGNSWLLAWGNRAAAAAAQRVPVSPALQIVEPVVGVVQHGRRVRCDLTASPSALSPEGSGQLGQASCKVC